MTEYSNSAFWKQNNELTQVKADLTEAHNEIRSQEMEIDFWKKKSQSLAKERPSANKWSWFLLGLAAGCVSTGMGLLFLMKHFT